MDNEEKKMLEETLAIEKENNELLHKVRRAQKQAFYSRVFYYVIVVGIGVGAFYFLQPYLDRVETFWHDTSSAFTKVKNVLPKE